MKIKYDSQKFMKEVNNFIAYHDGFFEGAQRNREAFWRNMASETIDSLKEFIDANARVSPETLHHVYEWHRTGSPEARLFDVKYRTGGGGLSIYYTLRQSSSVKRGSTTPFYNKAKIMESGVPVRISPVIRDALKFTNDAGEDVFIKSSVTVQNPGGAATTGSMERTFDSFFSNYFTQSFIRNSGVLKHLAELREYKVGLSKATAGGKMAGVAAGSKWISGRGNLDVEFIAP
jgi:hypothetical protein